jgi:hypothetical protein
MYTQLLNIILWNKIKNYVFSYHFQPQIFFTQSYSGNRPFNLENAKWSPSDSHIVSCSTLPHLPTKCLYSKLSRGKVQLILYLRIPLHWCILYIYFHLKCHLLSCPTSLSLHVSAVHGQPQVPSMLPKLFHCMLKLGIMFECNIDY